MTPYDQQQSVTLIAGPTAAGKSAQAEQMASTCHGIIINGDALQIYQDLPILTAQPDHASRDSVPHALYGILKPDQVCHVQSWLEMAIQAIKEAWKLGQHPIIVGGTGLYLKALTSGLSPLPDLDETARQYARHRQATLGNPGFHADLQKIDPLMAARLHPSDTQRLIRAYEVMTATGKSLAFWQDVRPVPPLGDTPFYKILIDAPREILRTRARIRLEQMVKNGVVEEIKEFVDRIDLGDITTQAGPTRALGYTPFTQYLKGKINLENALDTAHLDTCQYIKRQQTWFRHQMAFNQTITLV